jgi:hypothetical protein
MRIAIVALSFLLAACGSPSPSGYYYSQPSSGPTNVLKMDIDTGGHLVADPGKAVGIFAEYTAGGQWLLWTTCDTTSSGYLCGFDIVASVKAGEALAVENQTADLEDTDKVLRVDDGAVRLIFETDTDTDGVWLTAPAGETLELDAELDGGDPVICDRNTGVCQQIVSWPSGGAVQVGAPSNPVDLVPTAP